EEGEEHVLIDPNTLSQDGSVSIGVLVPSWDGQRVVYGLKRNNSDETTLHVLEVGLGRVSEIDVIDGAKYAHPSWTAEGDGFYYVWVPPLGGKITVAERPGFAELRFHRLGTAPKSDRLIHEATHNPETFLAGFVSRDGRWLFAMVDHGWN